MSPPINNIISTFYNNIIGKIIMLGLIIYYSNTNDDISHKLSLVLTILYILLMIHVNTQNNIENYGEDLHKNLYGGDGHIKDNTMDDDMGDVDADMGDVDDDVDGDDIMDGDDIEGDDIMDGDDIEGDDIMDDDNEGANVNMNATMKMSNGGGVMHDDDKYFSLNNMSGGNAEEEQLESTEEENMNIDSKIENIIQEEIVLNRKTYNQKLKEQRKLGVIQHKLNEKRKKVMNSLEKQANKYKSVEEEYNRIMEDVDKYDTNNDGVVDYNDVSPEMESAEEEIQQLKKEFKRSMKKLKPQQDKLDSMVVSEKVKTTGGSIELEGISNNLYSVPI
jgi:hypothetical protein